MEKIEIRLFGTPQVWQNGKCISLPYKKAEGLFYYLCVKKTITREEAISLLWGNEEQSNGKKRLRDAIYQIRRLLGKDVLLTVGHKEISLNPECPLESDWDEVQKSNGNKAAFLEYFYIKNCYEFEEWVQSIREIQKLEAMQDISQKLEKAREERDIKGIQVYGNLLLKNDPYNEELCYEIMNDYAKAGKYAMALQVYYKLKKRLKEDLGLEPDERIKELFRKIFQMKEYIKAKGMEISNLSGLEREILEYLSICPGRVSLKKLEYLTKTKAKNGLKERLEQLQDSLLIRELLVERIAYYEFSNGLLQEYVYEKLSREKKQVCYKMLSDYYGTTEI